MRPGRETVVIGLQGVLDVSTKQLLTGQLDEVMAQTSPHPPGLIIDLSQLTFCDSSGLSALVVARERLEAAGRPLALAGARGRVKRLLHRTGVEAVFHCYATAADAESALGR
ncbi:STAS domain-containing protein [Nonomuraea recticatena]